MSAQVDLLRVPEAAELLGIPARTLQRMAQRQEIPALMLAGRWRFHRDSLVRWLRDLERPAQTTTTVARGRAPKAVAKPAGSAWTDQDNAEMQAFLAECRGSKPKARQAEPMETTGRLTVVGRDGAALGVPAQDMKKPRRG